MCGKVCGGASVKVEDENGALERHQPAILPLPASHLPRAAPLPQPFWAAHAPDGRKGLLRMLEEDDVLPSHASAAVLVGRGLWRRWAHGGRESDLPLRQTMSGVMKKMCLSTQAKPTASPTCIIPSVAPLCRSTRPSRQ